MHTDSIAHSIIMDCTKKIGALTPIWRSFGYDEINWTYTSRGKKIYKQIGKLSAAPYYIRCHHTFTTGNGLSTPTKGSGNVYYEDEHGKPFYDFHYLDQIFDTMLQNNCKPIVELGFMPDALSSGPKPNPTYDYSGNNLWAYPPHNYQKWEELVFQTVKHFVKKYGRKEINNWFWELWNEPDNKGFFKGSVREYCKLYDYTIAGAIKALPSVKIGGPALAGRSKFLDKFLKHCSKEKNYVTGKKGTQLDFISFHAKGTGWPFHNKPFIMPSLKTIFSYLENYNSVFEKYPNYKNVDYLFDECDMEVATNFGMYDFPEFNFNNTEYYPIFVIRMMKNILDYMAQKNMAIKFFTTWAFYLEGKRYFEGNRALFTNENIKKPIFNAFVMLEMLGHTRIKLNIDAIQQQTTSFRHFPQVNGLATINNNNSAEIIIWNFDENNKKAGKENIELIVKSLPFACKTVSIQRYQIDNEHSNSYASWKKLGSLQEPTLKQTNKIKQDEILKFIEEQNKVEIFNNSLKQNIELPAQSVCLIKIYPD